MSTLIYFGLGIYATTIVLGFLSMGRGYSFDLRRRNRKALAGRRVEDLS